jgi:hypothetical protein
MSTEPIRRRPELRLTPRATNGHSRDDLRGQRHAPRAAQANPKAGKAARDPAIQGLMVAGADGHSQLGIDSGAPEREAVGARDSAEARGPRRFAAPAVSDGGNRPARTSKICPSGRLDTLTVDITELRVRVS